MAARRLTFRWRLIAVLAVGLLRLGRWRLDVQGLDHVPRVGGAVVVFNHHSYVDFVLVAWGPVKLLKRPIRILAKRELWRSRWTRWAVRWGDAVPVDRHSATARSSAFDAATEALRAGDLVAVAPEQTISPSFELMAFRTGAVRMAQAAEVPIVPAVGWGSHRFATKNHGPRMIIGLPVTIRYGEPIVVPSGRDPVVATRELRDRMTELLDEVQSSYPHGTPAGAWWVPARLAGGAPPPAGPGRPGPS